MMHVMCLVRLIVRAVHQVVFSLDDYNVVRAADSTTTLEEFCKTGRSDSWWKNEGLALALVGVQIRGLQGTFRHCPSKRER